MPNTLLPLALQHPAFHPALVSAEVMDQISQAVQQLLLAALDRASRADAAPTPVAARSHAPLSSRECEVLERLAAGESNKMIARALALSPHTVKRHVANILAKLNLRSRGQAAAWWLTQRQLPPSQ
jgi:LuxR family maltose regulon positive regulatory protein